MNPDQIRRLDLLRDNLRAQGFPEQLISRAIGVAASKFNPPVCVGDVNKYLEDQGLPQLPHKKLFHVVMPITTELKM